MINDLIAGAAMALNGAFGDDCKIYKNDVEQGLEEPCFLILTLNPSRTPMPNRRYLLRHPFDIHFFPARPDDNGALHDAAERMADALEVITLANGDTVRGTDVNFTVQDRVLHFFISYNVCAVRPYDPEEMETYELNERIG
jgi:hypothetical protein